MNLAEALGEVPPMSKIEQEMTGALLVAEQGMRRLLYLNTLCRKPCPQWDAPDEHPSAHMCERPKAHDGDCAFLCIRIRAAHHCGSCKCQQEDTAAAESVTP